MLYLLLALSIAALPLSLWGQFKYLSRGYQRDKDALMRELNIALDRNHYLVNKLPVGTHASWIPSWTPEAVKPEEPEKLDTEWEEV